MKTKHRLLALLLAIFQLMSIVVNPVFAAEVVDTYTEDTSAAVGSEANPEDANAKYFSYTGSYLLNTDFAEAGEYWYSFKAEQSGIVVIENFTYDIPYQVTVTAKGVEQDAVNAEGEASNPVATLPVEVGDEVLIRIEATEACKVYVNLFMADGSESDRVIIKSEGYFLANVAAGETVYYQGSANMMGMGMLVEGDDVSNTIVTVSGADVVDTDCDGIVEVTLPGHPNAAVPNPPMFSITNNSGEDRSYALTIVDAAAETEHIHEMVYTAAVDPSCHQTGNNEYWYCAGCDVYFADENGTQITNSKNVIIPALAELAYMPETEACHANGTYEYWYCAECDAVFADAAGTQLTNRQNLTKAAENELTHVAAVAGNCHQNGMAEYWYCAECEGYYLDAKGVMVTNAKSVILPELGNENLVHYEAVEPGCHDLGNVEYWYCDICDGYWTDEACTMLTNSKRVILPATGSENVEHVEAVAPTCHDNGNIEYWFCTDCERYFQDEACTQLTNSKRVILPAAGNDNMEHHEAVAATCKTEGNVEYWYCAECGGYYLDQEGIQLTNAKRVILPAVECASAAFSDLDVNAWYHDATDFVLNNGIMNGNENGTFAPESSLTRAELVQILYNIEGKPEVTSSKSFSDVAEGDWYYDAIMRAAENGVVLGNTDGTYAPEDKVTREQMVTILWRYAGSQEPAATELTFADAGQVSDWAETAVLWAVENGIVMGVGNNEFAPKANTERAAAAQVMMNYFNK